jgi:hypothetical protein
LAGFNKQAKHYYREKLKLDGDSIYFLIILNLMEGSREIGFQQH